MKYGCISTGSQPSFNGSAKAEDLMDLENVISRKEKSDLKGPAFVNVSENMISTQFQNDNCIHFQIKCIMQSSQYHKYNNSKCSHEPE